MIHVIAVFLASFLLHATSASAAVRCGVEDLLAGKAPSSSSATRGDLSLLTDGKVGPEGGQWNAPVAVTLDTTSSDVTYDLGEPRAVTAFVLQGDANDTYVISGSADSALNSFRPLAELPSVVNISGHGLRTRTAEISPATVRYLRVRGARGDGFYSIAELAVYCEKPSPFPPAMTVAVAPPQFAAGAPPAEGSRSFGPVYVFALIAFAVLARVILGRRLKQ
jgi:hypothetical protein